MVGTQDLLFTSRILGSSASNPNRAEPVGSAAVTLGAFPSVLVLSNVAVVVLEAVRGLVRFVFCCGAITGISFQC